MAASAVVAVLALPVTASAPAVGQLLPTLPTTTLPTTTQPPATTVPVTTVPVVTQPVPTVTVATAPTTAPRPRTTTTTGSDATTSSSEAPTTTTPATTVPTETTPPTSPLPVAAVDPPSYPWLPLLLTMAGFGAALCIMFGPMLVDRARRLGSQAASRPVPVRSASGPPTPGAPATGRRRAAAPPEPTRGPPASDHRGAVGSIAGSPPPDPAAGHRPSGAPSPRDAGVPDAAPARMAARLRAFRALGRTSPAPAAPSEPEVGGGVEPRRPRPQRPPRPTGRKPAEQPNAVILEGRVPQDDPLADRFGGRVPEGRVAPDDPLADRPPKGRRPRRRPPEG